MAAVRKEELKLYRKLTEEIWDEEERLREIEEKMQNVSAGSGTGSGGKNDYISIQVCIKDEILKKLQILKREAYEKRMKIENCIWKSNLTPSEKRIIRQRYIDHMSWNEILKSIYGRRKDFYEKEDTYRQRIYRGHRDALYKLSKTK